MTNVLNFAKVTTLPTAFVPSTVYLVEGTNVDQVDIYISSRLGDSVRHVVTMDEVLSLISEAVNQIPKPFQFQQIVPSDHWVIPNPFDIRPGVIITTSAGDLLETEIQYDMNKKEIHVLTTSPFSGTADIG
jgi:hypothetical protein